MLRPRRAASLLLLLGLLGPAWAQDDLGGIRQPEQLTIGVADQFLGQLAPDGKELYFLSNRNTIREVYHQDVEAGQPTLLFDEGADVSWARLSPDGRLLLYISFRDDAVGQLCVRDLQKGQRRCLTDGARAVEAQWMGPREIALVSRPSLPGPGWRQPSTCTETQAADGTARDFQEIAPLEAGRRCRVRCRVFVTRGEGVLFGCHFFSP